MLAPAGKTDEACKKYEQAMTRLRGVMAKQSAGLLLFRDNAGQLEVLLVHPGGPFWANKDDGAWSMPKGEFTEDEDAQTAALREFEEETGMAPQGQTIALDTMRQSGGK